jgi:hypothetical protein
MQKINYFLCGGCMIKQDSRDSLPCLVQEQQKVFFIFSQPRHSVPSLLRKLIPGNDLNNPCFPPKRQAQSPYLINTQMHHISLGVGQSVLLSDVKVSEITAFIVPSYLGRVRLTHFFVSSTAINLLLETATICIMQHGATARCTNQGIIFCRQMYANEVYYRLEVSRTPVEFTSIVESLGYR